MPHAKARFRRRCLRLSCSLLASDPGDAHTVIRSSTTDKPRRAADAATRRVRPCPLSTYGTRPGPRMRKVIVYRNPLALLILYIIPLLRCATDTLQKLPREQPAATSRSLESRGRVERGRGGERTHTVPDCGSDSPGRCRDPVPCAKMPLLLHSMTRRVYRTRATARLGAAP
jgi:hypothetical protein